MSDNATSAHEAMTVQIGKEAAVGEWFEVTQDRVNDFADATLDHQFIHVDPERAAQTPFGGPIAHGFLTLSLLVHLQTTIPDDLPAFDGLLMGVNYGFNKVRFISPVPVGSRIRATAKTIEVTLKDNAVDQVRTMTIEIEGQDKPALVADWIARLVFA